MSDNDSENIEKLEVRFQDLYKEYSKKVRKLKKSQRAAEARAYVQQRLREEAAHTEADKHRHVSDSSKLVKKPKTLKGRKSAYIGSTAKTCANLCNVTERCRNSDQERSPNIENIQNKTPTSEVRLHEITSAKYTEQPLINVESDKTREPPKAECNNAEVKCVDENPETEDISAESQDLFMTPLKPIDNSKPTSICLHMKTNMQAASDDEVIVIEQEKRVENRDIDRKKSHALKLKLSKYKKNVAGPINREVKSTKQKVKLLCSDSEKRDRTNLEARQEDVKGNNVGRIIPSGGSNLSLENSTLQISEDIISENQGHGPSGRQGTVFSEGQAVVFERQVKSEDKNENLNSFEDTYLKALNQTDRDGISHVLTNSISQSLPGNSVSTVFDNDPVALPVDNIKTKRRSGSRKRSLSGQGIQRRSTRLAGQSSQDSVSQSTEMEVTSPLFLNAAHTSAKKRVIISSVFQCLVDECRRKSSVEEFWVPSDYVKCDLIDQNSVEPNNQVGPSAMESHHSKTDPKDIVETGILKMGERKSEFYEENGTFSTEHVKSPQCSISTNLEKEEIISPTLFESQSDTGSFKFENDNNENEQKCDNSSVKAHTELKQSSETGDNKSECERPSVPSNNIYCGNTGCKESSVYLHQIASFQVPKGDSIQSLLCVEAVWNDVIMPYVVCLCSASLKLYTISKSQWTCVATCKHGSVSRKKSGTMMYSVPDTGTVSVIVPGVKSDCTCISMYTYTQQEWQHISLDKIFSKSIQVCPLSHQNIVVSYHTDKMTYLCKYFLDRGSGQWSSKQLDKTDKHITQLVSVKNIDAAVVAITKSSEIQIWNHEYGYLLSTVDVSDISLNDPVCPLAFSEQGFLFLPMLTRRKSSGPGSVIVINPNIGSSEVLTSICIQDPWTGCYNTCVMSCGLLMCRQSNGCVRVWNVYTGSLLTTVDDVTVTCFSATNQYCAIAHKQCIHLYKLNVTSLS